MLFNTYKKYIIIGQYQTSEKVLPQGNVELISTLSFQQRTESTESERIVIEIRIYARLSVIRQQMSPFDPLSQDMY